MAFTHTFIGVGECHILMGCEAVIASEHYLYITTRGKAHGAPVREAVWLAWNTLSD